MYWYNNGISTVSIIGVISRVVRGELTFDSKKRCLKIPEGLSEVVNQKTDNSMAKRKRTKGQTMIWKTLHRKLKIK
jgi:hypothetical protein